MCDNRTYRDDEVEGSGEDHLFSFEVDRDESKSDVCTDDSQDGDDLANQEQLANSDPDEEDTDIESDSEGTLRV